MRRILLLNGPNLNLLGRREKEHYGTFTLADVESLLFERAKENNCEIVPFQSNHEGEMLDFIQEHLDDADAMIINAGAFTHYSYALLDCLKICSFPIIEVHISDIEKREDFRKISVIREACFDHVSGLGIHSYTKALEIVLEVFEEKA